MKITRNSIQIGIKRMDGKSKGVENRRSLFESIIASTLWLICILIVALPRGLNTKIGTIGLPNNASPEQIRNAWGPGDAGSLMDTALTWAKFHQIDPTTQYWIVHLWTPGMSAIEIPLIWLARLGIPIFWSLLFITVAIWAIMFWFVWRYVSVLIGRFITAGVFLMLSASWDFKYMFRDNLFYTEGISFGLLCFGIGLITWALIRNQNTIQIYLVAGIIIGVSLMIRHVSDFGLSGFIVISVCGLFFQISQQKKYHLYKYFQKSKNKKIYFKNQKNTKFLDYSRLMQFNYFKLSLSGVAAMAVTLPWRFVSYVIFKGVPWSLSASFLYVGMGVWIPNSKIGIWASSGMNWACNIDPVKCTYLNQKPLSTSNNTPLLYNAIFSALDHPIAYLKFRWRFLEQNWIPEGIHNVFDFQVLLSFLPIVLLLLGIAITFKLRESAKVTWVWMPFLIMDVGQLLIVQFESRYFIPVRLFCLGFFLTALAKLRVSDPLNIEK